MFQLGTVDTVYFAVRVLLFIWEVLMLSLVQDEKNAAVQLLWSSKTESMQCRQWIALNADQPEIL